MERNLGETLLIMQTFIHYFLHLIFPVVLALLFFRNNWKQAYLIMLATMAVDIDHLLATPIFQANRCSINFHYLHTLYAIGLYFVLLFFRKPFNIIGLGLLFHMVTDSIDCLMTFSNCESCLSDSPIYDFLLKTSSVFGF